jgi:hypothetical protein
LIFKNIICILEESYLLHLLNNPAPIVTCSYEMFYLCIDSSNTIDRSAELAQEPNALPEIQCRQQEAENDQQEVDEANLGSDGRMGTRHREADTVGNNVGVVEEQIRRRRRKRPCSVLWARDAVGFNSGGETLNHT